VAALWKGDDHDASSSGYGGVVKPYV